jgi:branched-chain amino acid aminotransferase
MLLLAYINGEYRYPGQAMVPVNDLGLLRAYAVFDYLRTFNLKPFRLDDYLERLENSAKELSLPTPSREEFKSVINEMTRRLDLNNDISFRILITGGPSLDGISISKTSLIITAEKLPVQETDLYVNGVKLITEEYLRENPIIKSTNYLQSIKSNDLKNRHKAFEQLYYHQNNILETARNNFFVFKNDVLVTAKKDVLKGITRKVALELAAEHFKVEERQLKLDELKDCTEAFITGTTKKILPVVKVDELKIGAGVVGENTKKLMKLFDNYTKSW